MGENSGAEVFLADFSEGVSLRKYAMVFQSEVVAITAAAYELIRKAIKANSAFKTTSEVVADCKKMLSKLVISEQVELICISYCNFNGNEEADRLARQGRDQPFQ